MSEASIAFFVQLCSKRESLPFWNSLPGFCATRTGYKRGRRGLPDMRAGPTSEMYVQELERGSAKRARICKEVD